MWGSLCVETLRVTTRRHNPEELNVHACSYSVSRLVKVFFAFTEPERTPQLCNMLIQDPF